MFYILKRIGLALLTIWVVITVTFFVMHAVPGGPFMSEKAVSPTAQAALEAKYGLDKPLLEQYGTYLKDIVTKFDFGPSVKQRGRMVIDIIADGMKTSVKLGVIAAAIAGVAAACLGLAATWPLARLAVYLQRQRLAGTVDATFDAEYRSSLAVGTSDNLHQAWHAIHEETAQVIREAPLRLPFFGEFRRRQLDSAAAKVFASFQKGV